jgi:hypothetical protein
MIPTGTLRAMYSMTNPPELLGWDVVVDGKTVAALSYFDVVGAVGGRTLFGKRAQPPKITAFSIPHEAWTPKV